MVSNESQTPRECRAHQLMWSVHVREVSRARAGGDWAARIGLLALVSLPVGLSPSTFVVLAPPRPRLLSSSPVVLACCHPCPSSSLPIVILSNSSLIVVLIVVIVRSTLEEQGTCHLTWTCEDEVGRRRDVGERQKGTYLGQRGGTGGCKIPAGNTI